MAADFQRKRPEVAEPSRASRSGVSLLGCGWLLNFRILIVVLVLLGFGAFWLFQTMQATWGRQVHVVNGLPMAYTVSVNGNEIELPAGRHTTVKVAEGPLTVQPPAELGLEDIETEIRTSFWTRAWGRHCFVLNPDRCGLILWEEYTYSENPNSAAAAPYEIHVGRPFYHFNDIHYPFEKFPDQITIDEGTEVKKRGVSFLDQFVGAPFNAWQVIVDELGPDPGLAYLKTYTRALPEDAMAEQSLMLISTFSGDHGELVEFVRPVLSRRPLAIDWHRVYQEAIQRHEPDHDLVAEYEAVLAESPDDPDALYLLGRIVEYDRATQLWQQATAAPEPSAAAFGALAYREMAAGNWGEARVLLDRAIQLDPESARYALLRDTVWRGTHDRDHLLREAIAAVDAEPLDVVSVATLVNLHLHFDDQQSAEQVAKTFQVHLSTQTGTGEDQVPPEVARMSESYIQFLLAYGKGDAATAVDKARQTGDPADLFQAALLAGNLDVATEQLSGDAVTPSAADHLLVACLAFRHRQADIAREHLRQAAAVLEQGGVEERRLAAWLVARQPRAEDLRRLAMDVERKRIALAALGFRYPTVRQEAFALAAKLNVTPGPPQAFIRKVLR